MSGNSPDSADKRILGEQQRIDALDSKVDSKIDLGNRSKEDNDKLTKTYIDRTLDLRGRLRDMHQTVLVRMDMRADWQPLQNACSSVEENFRSLLYSIRTGDQLFAEQQSFNTKVDEFLKTLQDKEQQTKPKTKEDKKDPDSIDLSRMFEKTPKNTQELFEQTLPALKPEDRNRLAATAEKQYGTQKVREIFARVTLVNRLSPTLCESLYGVVPPLSIAEVASQMGQDVGGTPALDRSPNAFLAKKDVAADVRMVRQRMLDDAIPIEQEWSKKQEQLQAQNKKIAEALKRSSTDANAAYLNEQMVAQRALTGELGQLRQKLQTVGQRAANLDLALTLADERLTRLSGGSLEADRILLHVWEKYGSSVERADPELGKAIGTAKIRLLSSGTLTDMERKMIEQDQWQQWNEHVETERDKNPNAPRIRGYGNLRPNESVRSAVKEQRETGTESFIRGQLGPSFGVVGEEDPTAGLVRRAPGAEEPPPDKNKLRFAPSVCGFRIQSYGGALSEYGYGSTLPIAPSAPLRNGYPQFPQRGMELRVAAPQLYQESRDRSEPKPLQESLYSISVGFNQTIHGVAFDKSARDKMQNVPAGMTLVLTRKPAPVVHGETWKESSYIKHRDMLRTLPTIRSYDRITAEDLAFAKYAPSEGQKDTDLILDRGGDMIIQKDLPQTGKDTNAKMAEVRSRKLTARDSLNLEQRGVEMLEKKFGGKVLGERLHLVPPYGNRTEETVERYTLVEVQIPPYTVRCVFDGKVWTWSEVALSDPPNHSEAGVTYGEIDKGHSRYEQLTKINDISTSLLELSVEPRQHTVIGADVHKKQQERSRDVLRALDQDKDAQAVVGAAGKMNQHLGLLQEVLRVHQTGTARNRPESFVQQIKFEAKQVINIIEDPELLPSIIKTLGTLQDLKKVVTTSGKWESSAIEKELDERIKSLQEFSDMLTKGEVKAMCASLLDRSNFYDDSWAEWFRVNAPKIIAGAVIVTAVLLSWGTASPLVTAVLIAGTSLAANEATAEAERFYYREVLGDKYYQGGSMLGNHMRRRGEYIKNGQDGAPPSFMNEVLEPYAKEFFINLGMTLATMGIGAQLGKALSALAQRSNFIQGGISRIPSVNKLATWMSRNENALLNPKHPPWVMEYLKGVGTSLRDGLLAQPAMEKVLEKGSEHLFGETMDGLHQVIAPVTTVLLIAACHFQPKRTVQVKSGTLGEFTYNVKGVRPEEATLQTKQLLAERGFLAKEGQRPGEFIVTHPEGHTFMLVPDVPHAVSSPSITKSPGEQQRRAYLKDIQSVVRELPANSPERIKIAGELLGVDIPEGSEGALAIKKAHEIGQRTGRNLEKEPFTSKELSEKARILRNEGKFTMDQIDVLMRSGIAGLHKEMPITMGYRVLALDRSVNQSGAQQVFEFLGMNNDGTVRVRRTNRPPENISIMDLLSQNPDIRPVLSISEGQTVKVTQEKAGGGFGQFDYEYRGVTGEGQVHLFSPRSQRTKTVTLDQFLSEHPEIQCRLIFRAGAEPAPPTPAPVPKIDHAKPEVFSPANFPAENFSMVDVVGRGEMLFKRGKDGACTLSPKTASVEDRSMAEPFLMKKGNDGKFYAMDPSNPNKCFEVRFKAAENASEQKLTFKDVQFPVRSGGDIELVGFGKGMVLFNEGKCVFYKEVSDPNALGQRSDFRMCKGDDGKFYAVDPKNESRRFEVRISEVLECPVKPGEKIILPNGTKLEYVSTDERGFVIMKDMNGQKGDYHLDRLETGRYQLVSPRSKTRYDIFLPSEKPANAPYAPYKKFEAGDRLCVLRKGDDGSYVLEEGWVLRKDPKGELRAYNEKQGLSKPFDAEFMVHAADALAGRLPEAMDAIPAAQALKKRQEFLNKNSSLPEKEFQFLFGRKDLKQQNVGNCYLVSALHSLGKSPQFETLIRTSITQRQRRIPETNEIEIYYEVKIPLGDPSAKPVTVYESDFMDPTRTMVKEYRPLEGADGWKILEAAYTIKVAGRDELGQPRRKETSGGFGSDALQVLLGSTKAQKTCIENGQVVQPFSSPEKISGDKRGQVQQWLNSFFPGKDVATANTPRRQSDREIFSLRDVHGQEWQMHYTHAYSIVDVNRAAQTVTVVNPHDTRSQRITMTYDTFMSTFSDISAVRLDATTMFNTPSSNGQR